MDNCCFKFNGQLFDFSNSSPEDMTDDIVLDFTSGTLTYTMYSPYNMQITGITNVNGTPATTITKNGSPYTTGIGILLGDTLVITVSVSSVIRLNILKL